MKKASKNSKQDWESKKFKDVLEYERPDVYIVKSTNYTNTGNIPVLTANKSFILGYTDEDFGICEDIPAIIFDDFTTDSKYVDFPFKVKSSAIKILRCRDNSSDLKFIYELIKNTKFTISNHKRYYISQYQNLDIRLPAKEEQKKIVEILRSVDDEIQKTNELIEQTRKLKNGLTQELFTKGLGQKKFRKSKIGSIPENWELKSVDEVCKTSSGGTPLKNKSAYYQNGSIPWLTSGEVREGKIYKATQYITEEGLKNSSAKLFPVDTILIAMYGVTAGQVGMLKIKASTNQAICGVFPDAKFIPEFLYQFFLSKSSHLRSLAGGGAQPNISQKIIREQYIPIPSLTEQQQIAEILSNVDEKISITQKIKDNLINLKKGLMQDLLSGKVRTKVI